MTIEFTEISSPVGKLTLAAADGALCLLEFEGRGAPLGARLRASHPSAEVRPGPCRAIVDRLEAYFGGALGALAEIAVSIDHAPRGTAFQRKVWTALQRIPIGTTTTYGAIADTIGAPNAVRAVGAANGQNPIALVVPCHRVIAKTGKLHGYGGGLDRKAWLLRHEGASFAE